MRKNSQNDLDDSENNIRLSLGLLTAVRLFTRND